MGLPSFLLPVWAELYMEAVIELYTKSVFPSKQLELLCLAFDASYTHLYAPGTRLHIKNAMKAGATLAEIMEVLKLSVIQGVQARNLGVVFLPKRLTALQRARRRGRKQGRGGATRQAQKGYQAY